jgi:hypothetical protein
MIRDFINENIIDFSVGQRNSSITTLIGFSQFKGLTKSQLSDELSDEINKDIFIQEELDRLWDYCKARNYKNWWSTTEAKLQYTF